MKNDQILLDHGNGGKVAHNLISDLLLPILRNPILERLEDGATLDINGTRLAFSTDSYVVDPIFFPGGNIGDLAVHGTVNDIAMCGATPLYLSAGLIIEEGFPMADLERILKSMAMAAKAANVSIVTGDTKVVGKGSADKIFINTAGIGIIDPDTHISGHHAQTGDQILISGTIGDHGVSILSQREGLSFESSLKSDTAPLNHMVAAMLKCTKNIHVLRDPTRGGLGTTLNEIAVSSKTGIQLFEHQIPIRDDVSGLCELLGFDPIYIANEGKLIAMVPAKEAHDVLAVMQQNPLGKNACIIGQVVSDHPGQVFIKTRIGGTRRVDMLSGEQLPRIC